MDRINKTTNLGSVSNELAILFLVAVSKLGGSITIELDDYVKVKNKVLHRTIDKDGNVIFTVRTPEEVRKIVESEAIRN